MSSGALNPAGLLQLKAVSAGETCMFYGQRLETEGSPAMVERFAEVGSRHCNLDLINGKSRPSSINLFLAQLV
ncbi:hypothetical protein KCU85_g338, partial [Aureobasidium melanogenum]